MSCCICAWIVSSTNVSFPVVGSNATSKPVPPGRIDTCGSPSQSDHTEWARCGREPATSSLLHRALVLRPSKTSSTSAATSMCASGVPGGCPAPAPKITFEKSTKQLTMSPAADWTRPRVLGIAGRPDSGRRTVSAEATFARPSPALRLPVTLSIQCDLPAGWYR
eukprot:SAG11_NODE_3677_length_2293_cov_3.032361_3_plen_165_part_00